MNIPDTARRIEPAGLKELFSSQWAHAWGLGLWLLSLVLFRQPLSGLADLSFHDEQSSHLLLIPVISALLVFLDRRRIFRASRPCPSIGVSLLLGAAALWYTLKIPLAHLDNVAHLSVLALLIVQVWIAVFVLVYGTDAFKEAAFPLLFLSLMIPIPPDLTEKTVSVLQRGSAEACNGLFRLVGVPFIRHGFQFSLPGVDIEVAEQCSGIHSALSLFIAGLVMQHFLLQGFWKKTFFALSIFPIAIFKNAVRIVTIAWLGIHVSPEFFHGQLHRKGGLPFSVLAVALLLLLLLLLRRLPSLFGKAWRGPEAAVSGVV